MTDLERFVAIDNVKILHQRNPIVSYGSPPGSSNVSMGRTC
jgi:hypothetical protein